MAGAAYQDLASGDTNLAVSRQGCAATSSAPATGRKARKHAGSTLIAGAR
jgi:hypothetical protein